MALDPRVYVRGIEFEKCCRKTVARPHKAPA
jgi:hypothetical protein